jgi:RsiW-degrading membrane proteinase PrsW (M82 family)
MTVPAAFAENALDIVLPTFAISVIAASLVEESLKFLVVRKTVYETPDFNKPIGGIAYATHVSLSCATLENLGYFLLSYQTRHSPAVRSGGVFISSILLARLNPEANRSQFSNKFSYRSENRDEPKRYS